MTPRSLRAIGIICLLAGLVLMALNLRAARMLGVFWLGPPLLIIGAAFLARARRARL